MPVTTPVVGVSTVVGQRPCYRLVRRLATRPGAEHSLVYSSEGPRARLSVLKRLPLALATDAVAVEKFRIEARIAATLEHPSIVRVFEIAETATEDFYTMEYVRGADMRQLMDALVAQKRTLPLDCVLLIALELCIALDYAHNLIDPNGLPAPVIHRELSPSKVLLGIDGAVKLTGFGAPPLSHSRPRRSRTESVGYTSPERFVGETMDSRSDIFALGVLIYELSSGERLFGDVATEHEIMQKILRGDMPRPSEVRRGYPRELETILMRTLARDRKERYQSASQLQTDLETFLWSRWPTASTASLAKLVNETFPSDEASDIATGMRELDGEMWLGPVPLASVYPTRGEVATARTDTNELRRLAPDKFPDSSGLQFPLGAAGPKARLEDLQSDDPTIDELAVPLEHPTADLVDDDITTAEPRQNRNVIPRARRVEQISQQQTIVRKADAVLGTPGAKPAPLGTQPPPIAQAPRGQYQRPGAVDDHWPENPDDIIELPRKKRANSPAPRISSMMPPSVAAVEHAPCSGQFDFDPPILLIPRPLPPPPKAHGRRWPLGTIAAIVGVVIAGVMASAYTIRSTVHEPSDRPAAIVAQPSAPTAVVSRTTQPEPMPLTAAVVDVKKAKPRAAAKRTEPAKAEARAEPPKPEAAKSSRPLFPPPDRLPVPPSAGSLDGLPSIKRIELKGSIGDIAVRRSVEQILSPLRGCYRAAARAKQRTQRVDLAIEFDVDERRSPRNVHARGGGELDALAGCAAKVTSDIRDLPAPRGGTVRVSVSLEFRPNP